MAKQVTIIAIQLHMGWIPMPSLTISLNLHRFNWGSLPLYHTIIPYHLNLSGLNTWSKIELIQQSMRGCQGLDISHLACSHLILNFSVSLDNNSDSVLFARESRIGLTWSEGLDENRKKPVEGKQDQQPHERCSQCGESNDHLWCQ